MYYQQLREETNKFLLVSHYKTMEVLFLLQEIFSFRIHIQSRLNLGKHVTSTRWNPVPSLIDAVSEGSRLLQTCASLYEIIAPQPGSL